MKHWGSWAGFLCHKKAAGSVFVCQICSPQSTTGLCGWGRNNSAGIASFSSLLLLHLQLLQFGSDSLEGKHCIRHLASTGASCAKNLTNTENSEKTKQTLFKYDLGVRKRPVLQCVPDLLRNELTQSQARSINVSSVRRMGGVHTLLDYRLGYGSWTFSPVLLLGTWKCPKPEAWF